MHHHKSLLGSRQFRHREIDLTLCIRRLKITEFCDSKGLDRALDVRNLTSKKFLCKIRLVVMVRLRVTNLTRKHCCEIENHSEVPAERRKIGI